MQGYLEVASFSSILSLTIMTNLLGGLSVSHVDNTWLMCRFKTCVYKQCM